jgi:hypothetical protein
MGDHVISAGVTVATAIVGIAIIAVLVSKGAQTPQVIQAAAAGLGGDIQAAVSPLSLGGGISGGLSSSFTGGGVGSSIAY